MRKVLSYVDTVKSWESDLKSAFSKGSITTYTAIIGLSMLLVLALKVI